MSISDMKKRYFKNNKDCWKFYNKYKNEITVIGIDISKKGIVIKYEPIKRETVMVKKAEKRKKIGC